MKNLFNNTLDFSRLYSMVALKRGLLLLMFLVSVPTFAQDCVTKFMGIPVDGTKEEMISALEKKGFMRINEDGLLGDFNGERSMEVVRTNKERVCAVVVAPIMSIDKTSVPLVFNGLFNQLESNSKYKWFRGKMIFDKEDVDYEMSVHDKLYQAWFFQVDDCSEQVQNKRVSLTVNRVEGGFCVVISYINGGNLSYGDDL